MPNDKQLLLQAIELARLNMERGGRPFGALLVRDNKVLASAVNEIHLSQDPTAHAELLAIRQASQSLQSSNLKGSVIFASGQPCPMCLSAMYLSGVSRVVYAGSNEEAEPFNLSTAELYRQLDKPLVEQQLTIEHLPQADLIASLYARWQSVASKS